VVIVSEDAAVSVPDGSGFSVESLIDEANRAWDRPDDTPSGTEPQATEDTASPEVRSAESPTPEPSTQEVVTDRGDGRDAKGRFAPKGEPAGKQDQAAEVPEDAVSPTQEPKAEAPPETPLGEAAKAVEDQAQPYSVRFNGRDYEIPGAVRTEGHLVIPIEQEETISRYVGMGLKYETERETVKQEKARLAVEREMFTAETGPVMEEVKRLFEIAGLPDEEQFATAFTQYAWELRNSLPLLRERMELSKQRQEIAIQKRMNAPDPEVQAEQLATSTFTTAQQHLSTWRTDPQLKSFKDEDLGWVMNRVQRDPASFLKRAGERLTPTEAEAGVSPGEVYFNQTKLLELVNDRLEWRTELERRDAEARKAVAEAKKNALRQANGVVNPPPVSGGADGPPSPESTGPKQYTSLDDLKRDLGVAW